MTKTNAILAAATLFFAGMCAFQGNIIAGVSNQNKIAVHAYCGAYDVKVVPHDKESYEDAAYATLRVVHDPRNDCSLLK